MSIGIAVDALGVPLARAAATPPAAGIVQYAITERDAFQAYLRGTDAMPTSRVFLARPARGTTWRTPVIEGLPEFA